MHVPVSVKNAPKTDVNVVKLFICVAVMVANWPVAANAMTPADIAEPAVVETTVGPEVGKLAPPVQVKLSAPGVGVGVGTAVGVGAGVGLWVAPPLLGGRAEPLDVLPPPPPQPTINIATANASMRFRALLPCTKEKRSRRKPSQISLDRIENTRKHPFPKRANRYTLILRQACIYLRERGPSVFPFTVL